MKLTVFNGSPRAQASNTKILLEHFSRGYLESNPDFKVENIYLAQVNKKDEFVEMFEEASQVILAFPLYTDAMPGLVKRFIEDLEPFCGRENNPSIGFIVQSGFPEAIHSRYVEKYLEKLARRLGCPYVGTVIKGSVEGIQIQPPSMTRKLFESFYQLGLQYGKTKIFDPAIVRQLAGRERFTGMAKLLVRVIKLTGVMNIYWNKTLKKNHVYHLRDAKPYQDKW